jgi:hypothetical protein
MHSYSFDSLHRLFLLVVIFLLTHTFFARTLAHTSHFHSLPHSLARYVPLVTFPLYVMRDTHVHSLTKTKKKKKFLLKCIHRKKRQKRNVHM